MGIPFKVMVKNVTKKDHKKIKNIVDQCFEEIDTTLNGWNKNSEIARWNAQKTTLPIKISKTLEEIITLCNIAHKQTKGRFDPSLGNIIKKWKQVLKIGAFLSQEEIDTLAPSVGWDKISLFKGTLQKHHPDVEIDLDGISKGYFCDICTKALVNQGFNSVLVEWGGEVKVQNGPFTILIGGKATSLTNKSVATSGYTYQIYPINKDGKIYLYSHIIDPKSLKPIKIDNLEKEKSIFSKSCALADALATSEYL